MFFLKKFHFSENSYTGFRSSFYPIYDTLIYDFTHFARRDIKTTALDYYYYYIFSLLMKKV